MPRSFKLTWQQGDNCRVGRWRKKYKGKAYYFDGGRGKFDREAYDAALTAWEAQKATVDAAAPRPHQLDYDAAIATWEQVLAWSNRYRDVETAQAAFEKLAQLRRRLEEPMLRPLAAEDRFESQFVVPTFPISDELLQGASAGLTADTLQIRGPVELNDADRARYAAELDGSPTRIASEIWRDRLQTQQRRAAAPEDSLHGYVEQYLTHKQQRADAGEVSVGRLYAIRLHLTHFQDWLGRDTAVREINGDAMVRYHTSLLGNVKAKKWSRTTARHYMVTVKSFMRWLWQIDAITSLPRVLDGKVSDLLNISTPQPNVVVFTKAEIGSLLKEASDRTKLYVLLMLNCGMTQKDVSDLRIDEVDWKEGRIIRKRSKTSEHENVPTVSYLLWPETFRLLQQERNPGSGGQVLRNSNGSELWTETLGPDGKYKKNDNVKNAFDRLRKTAGVNKPLKSLKKTSATLLRGDQRFQGLEGLFLGHAPQSMSDRHYTQVPGKLLDQAIQWLEQELGVGSAVK